MPEVDVAALTLVRPVPWAQALGDLRFVPSRWGDTVVRIAAPGGSHLLIRRHQEPELAHWLPDGFEPQAGAPFGLYLHPDRRHVDRVRAAAAFRRAIGPGPPLRRTPYAQAHRQSAMLCIHDLAQTGASLRDIAGALLDPMPGDWRSSSERADLRRLAEAGRDMVAGGYRALLLPSWKQS